MEPKPAAAGKDAYRTQRIYVDQSGAGSLTSDEQMMHDVSKDGRVGTAYFARVVAAVFWHDIWADTHNNQINTINNRIIKLISGTLGQWSLCVLPKLRFKYVNLYPS